MAERKQVLVAEDEEHIAKLVAFKLTHEGFEVVVASHGQEAIDRLGQRPWSLVILDVMMPFKDGWQVLREIRANPAHQKIPVLMLTAKNNAQDMANAAELGATQFLKKPFKLDHLAETVRQLVSEVFPEGKT